MVIRKKTKKEGVGGCKRELKRGWMKTSSEGGGGLKGGLIGFEEGWK